MSLDGPAPSTWVTSTEATPEPTVPEVVENVDPDLVTPGVLGFLVTLAAVLACIPLFLSMTGKLRRMEHRARSEERARLAESTASTASAEPIQPAEPTHPADPADPIAPPRP